VNRVYIGFGALTFVFLVGFFWLTRKGAREKRIETMKAIVWFCLCNGCGWVWCSYLLAYLGRTEIAESLSKIALTDIVVVVLTYAGKALVEQLSKYNKWPDKPAKKEEDNV
jgi:FtsH-binding integral membrane protein